MHSASAGPSGRLGVGILRAGAPPRLGGSRWRPLEALKSLLAERRGPILPLGRRCWLQLVVLAESWPNWRSRLFFLPFSVLFRHLLLICSALLLSRPPTAFDQNRASEWNWPFRLAGTSVKCNCFRSIHGSPFSSLALSRPPRDGDSDPSSAGHPARRDASQDLVSAPLFLGSAAPRLAFSSSSPPVYCLLFL
ncbi:hypothetical protein HDV57DRAFT_5780 [Trichoderma longibrachiatum]